MPLASTSDTQSWMPADGRTTISQGDDAAEQINAERIIKAYLSERVSLTVMNAWTATNSPPLIRHIAGKLAAAFYYRKVFTQGGNEVSDYALMLYNEAMAYLNGIVNGTFLLLDSTGTVITTTATSNLNADHFYPNEDGNQSGDSRKFSMTMEF